MVHVRDAVGHARQLAFDRVRDRLGQRLLDPGKHLEVAPPLRVPADAVADLPRQVEAVFVGARLRAPVFEQFDDPEALHVVTKSTVPGHQPAQLLLAGVPEWRVPEVVRQHDRLCGDLR